MLTRHNEAQMQQWPCREACGGWLVRTLATCLFALRRFIIASRSYRPKWLSDTFLHMPALMLAEVCFPVCRVASSC